MKNNKSRRNFLQKLAWGGAIAATISSSKALANQPYASRHPLPKNLQIYWKQIRNDFPLSRHRMYFNTASLGPSPKIVIDTVHQCMQELNFMGEERHDKVNKVRTQIAHFIHCETDEVTITRNTTEGINIVAQSLPLKKGDEIILTKHAHIGGAAPWLALQQQKGIKIKLVDLDLTGKENFNLIKKAISRKTRAIVVSHITCTTGMVLPIKDIIQLCQEKGIYSCIDGAHPLGMIQLDMNSLQPDFYASSGHKWLLGPKGTGILYINKNIIEELNPSYVGAHSDSEYDLESKVFKYGDTAQRHEYGTRNTPIIMGLGAAITYINTIGIVNIEHRSKNLAQYLKKGLSKIKNVEILTPMNLQYSAAMVTFRIKGKKYQDIQEYLRFHPKCRTRGIHENDLNAVRISCAFYNNFDEMDKVITAIKDFT